VAVDFIERWFHVSPDSGSGAVELLYLALVSLIVVAVVRYRRRARAPHAARRHG
jgi:hypothetical protein